MTFMEACKLADSTFKELGWLGIKYISENDKVWVFINFKNPTFSRIPFIVSKNNEFEPTLCSDKLLLGRFKCRTEVIIPEEFKIEEGK